MGKFWISWWNILCLALKKHKSPATFSWLSWQNTSLHMTAYKFAKSNVTKLTENISTVRISEQCDLVVLLGGSLSYWLHIWISSLGRRWSPLAKPIDSIIRKNSNNVCQCIDGNSEIFNNPAFFSLQSLY